jgi:hypothetical protein
MDGSVSYLCIGRRLDRWWSMRAAVRHQICRRTETGRDPTVHVIRHEHMYTAHKLAVTKKTQRYVRTYARDHAVLLTARGKGPVHKASGKRHARPKLKAGKWQWLLDTRHMHDFSGKKATSTEIWGISDDSTWHIYIASVYAQKILSLVFRGPIKLADDTHSFWVCEDTIPWRYSRMELRSTQKQWYVIRPDMER